MKYNSANKKTSTEKIHLLKNKTTLVNQKIPLKFMPLITALLLLSIIPITKSACGHDTMEKPANLMLKVNYSSTNNWQPIRILADYSHLPQIESAEAQSFANLLKSQIIPKTISVLESILRVRRLDSFTLNNAFCSKHLQIPEHLLNKQILNADLLIIVSFDTTGKYKANKVEASAVHCYQDELTKRSIVGKITFREDLNPLSAVDIDYMVWLSLHEISHVLLFNRALYKHFIDELMQPLGISNVLIQTANQKGQKIYNIKTKRVLAKAVQHYNCPGLQGVPLEFNTGGKSAISGHWSRRAMNTDYMIGRSHGENLITEITLAFFEDSGWYKADYAKANIFFWGKGRGCNFFLGSCIKTSRTSEDLLNIMVRTHHKKEFCQYINQPACSMHNQFRGFCGAKVYKHDLPLNQQNFDSPRVGGYDSFVNRCPIVVENKLSQAFYGGNCKFGAKEGLSEFELICPECACFLSSLRRNANEEDEEIPKIHSYSKEPHLKAACYKFGCKNNLIYVQLDGKEYLCPSARKLSIPGYFGRVYCPNKRVLCDKKYFCKFGCTDVQ